MGKIRPLIANANDKFTNDEVAIFQEAAKAAEDFISANFNFDYDVDIVITAPVYLLPTIPEDGITARTYTSHFIIVVVDKQQAAITEDFVFETICHEMSHSLRWEKLPEYGDTLFKDMILEGLAIVLEEKAMADTKRKQTQYFFRTMQETDQAMIDDITSQLKGKFNSEQYDHQKVLFTGDDKLPRWAGYRLGYYFVKKYLDATGSTINEATLASYGDFEKVLEI
ncbi:MAG TPA: DUF2268 domain-containing putative Zn-dependent protease [Candidatus Saccharimonadales bacterium]|nr:DUF2268 domain-containing putative Zn-dependent protease [Candidatus Saccharimonadales bacterium]